MTFKSQIESLTQKLLELDSEIVDATIENGPLVNTEIAELTNQKNKIVAEIKHLTQLDNQGREFI